MIEKWPMDKRPEHFKPRGPVRKKSLWRRFSHFVELLGSCQTDYDMHGF